MSAEGEATDLLDQVIDRLYQHTKHRYFEVMLAIETAWLLIVLVPLGVLVGRLFLELDSQQTLRLLVSIEVANALATPGVVWIVLRRSRPAIRWLRGEPGADPAAAWAAVVIDLPGTILRGAIWTMVWVTPGIVYAGSYARLSSLVILGWVVAVTLWVAGAAFFCYLVFERGLRPVVRGVVPALPRDFEPPRGGVSLRTKLLVFLLLLNMFSGFIVGAVTTNSTNSLSLEWQLAAVLGTAIAFTLTFALALSVLVRESVLTRIEKLRGAMGRVDRGEYDAHIPPLGGDELDELGQSFNQMVDRLRRHDEELRESSARIVTASDAGRRQVERDLHDGAQQQLVTLQLRLGMAQQAFETDPARAAALVAEARSDLSRALDELRDLAHGIYPAALTIDGLPAALEVAGERCALPVAVECDDANGRLAPEVEAAVYFCCVEALQNAAKHAGSGAMVRIHLRSDPGEFRFEVRDDGVGYDPATLGISVGLQNMADRIGALGGTVRVESAPGAGTAVIGAMPRDESQGVPR